MQTEKSQNASYVCPYILEKIKADINNIRYLSIRPRPQRGNMGYYTMQGVLHALCNAHHLRELKALVEIEKEEWARKMQRLLRRACHAANLARQWGGPLKPLLITCFERRYAATLAE